MTVNFDDFIVLDLKLSKEPKIKPQHKKRAFLVLFRSPLLYLEGFSVGLHCDCYARLMSMYIWVYLYLLVGWHLFLKYLPTEKCPDFSSVLQPYKTLENTMTRSALSGVRNHNESQS